MTVTLVEENILGKAGRLQALIWRAKHALFTRLVLLCWRSPLGAAWLLKTAELGLEIPFVQAIAWVAFSYNYFQFGGTSTARRATLHDGTKMIDKLDSALRFHQDALNLRARRQEVLSANIANADTPNFKARDLDFSANLSQAMERGRQSMSVSMSTTSSRHIAGDGQAVGDADLLYRTPAQSSLDGNTVEMDVERVNFADNALRYEADLTVLSSKIKSLLSAVQQ